MYTDIVEQDVVVVNPWQAGFNAYCEGAQLEEMSTDTHRRGWWAALAAQAGAEMPVVVDIQAEAEEYEDDMLDREWWSRGAW